MPRLVPSPPAPSAAIADSSGRPTTEYVGWFATLYAALLNRVPVTGSATFAAATTVAVTFATAEADASYDIWVAPAANRTYWASSKTTAGFTLNASASNSDTVRWMLIRS